MLRPVWRITMPASARELHHHRRHFSAESLLLQNSIRSATESRNYTLIPTLVSSTTISSSNPFSFLSSYPPPLAARYTSDLLQSLQPLRPRSVSHQTISFLQSFLFPITHFFFLSLSVLQFAIRSGFAIERSSVFPLSKSYLCLEHRCPDSVLICLRKIDTNTFNQLLSSLCFAGEVDKAVHLLRGITNLNSNSYCIVIEALPWNKAENLLMEMVVEKRMVPRRGSVSRVVAMVEPAKRAAELVRVLEMEGCRVSAQGYEAVVKNWVREGEIVMAAKTTAEMARRGMEPCLKVRRKVVEGLAAVGQLEIALELGKMFAKIGG